MRGFSGDEFEPAVGELRLVRGFRLWDDGGLGPLSLVARQDVWVDGRNEAFCSRGFVHDAPDGECSCGFYAYYEPAPTAYVSQLRASVVGVISIWGRSIVGSKGARSQFARIDALWLPPSVTDDVADAVWLRYPSAAIYRTDSPDTMFAAWPMSPPPGRRVSRVAASSPGLVASVLQTLVLLLALIGAQVASFGAWADSGGLAAIPVRLVADAVLLAAIVRLGRRYAPSSPVIRIGVGPMLGIVTGVVFGLVSHGLGFILALPSARIAWARLAISPRREVTPRSREQATTQLEMLSSPTWIVSAPRPRSGGFEIVSRRHTYDRRPVVYYRHRTADGRLDLFRGRRALFTSMTRALGRHASVIVTELPGDYVDVTTLFNRADSAQSGLDTVLRPDDVCRALRLPPAALGR